MHLVVDALLNTPLRSLEGKKLSEMFNFVEEEKQRIYAETYTGQEDEGKFTPIGLFRLYTPAAAIGRFKGLVSSP